MKKLIFAIFSIIFMGLAITGSVFLLAGCDQSYSQKQEESEENIPDDDIKNNEEQGEEEDTDNDDETEKDSYDFDFSVTSVFFYNGTHASYYGDWAMQYDDFYAYWRDQNGTNQNFNDITYREYGRNSSAVTESKGYQVYDCVYIHYDASGGIFAGSPKRYCAISATEGMYKICGVYSTINNSYGRTRVARDLEVIAGGASGIYEFYIYGSGGLTTNESIAKSNASKNMSGTYYIYHRARYIASFYNAKGSNDYYNSVSFYSGVGYKLLSAPTRSGYVFTGWKDSATTLDEFKKNISSTTYLTTFSANVESFSPTGTTSSSQSANMFIASADEISSVLNNKTGLSKYSVKFSDLVSDILGNGIKQYYTRNLGSNTSTIKSYTELGMATQNLCTNLQGVQFTIKVSEYGCV